MVDKTRLNWMGFVIHNLAVIKRHFTFLKQFVREFQKFQSLYISLIKIQCLPRILIMYTKIILTVVQYSCIGCVILWFLYRPPFPAKKQSWHISKLKHLRQRYLKCVNWHLEDFYINIYSIPESKNRILLADITFCLMLCSLCRCESTTRFHQKKILRHQRAPFFYI